MGELHGTETTTLLRDGSKLEIRGRDHRDKMVILGIIPREVVWDVEGFSGRALVEYGIRIRSYTGRERDVDFIPAFFTLYIDMLTEFCHSRQGQFVAGGVGKEDWVFRIFPLNREDGFVVHVRLRALDRMFTPELAIAKWPIRGTPVTLEAMFVTDQVSLAETIEQAKRMQAAMQELKRNIDSGEA